MKPEGRRRRWPWFAAAFLVVVTLVAATFWFLFVPNWRPPLRADERYGIDVSHHQGTIDWRAVADDGIGFAYMKATEGADHTDARFTQNWRDARAAGIQRGAYHFFTLCSSGRAQAEHFLAVAPPDRNALAPGVDLEIAGNCSTRPPSARVMNELSVFLRIVDTAWHKAAVVYVRDDWTRRYPTPLTDHPQWKFRFLRRPSGKWSVWQVHGFARVNGVHGRVDLDIAATQGAAASRLNGASRRVTRASTSCAALRALACNSSG